MHSNSVMSGLLEDADHVAWRQQLALHIRNLACHARWWSDEHVFSASVRYIVEGRAD